MQTVQGWPGKRYKLEALLVLVCYRPLDNVTRLHTGRKVVGFALDNQSAVLTGCALPIMVLPLHIIDAARRGNSRVVMAWLDTAPQGSVNDEGQFPHGPFMLDPGTLLSWTCLTHVNWRAARPGDLAYGHTRNPYIYIYTYVYTYI